MSKMKTCQEILYDAYCVLNVGHCVCVCAYVYISRLPGIKSKVEGSRFKVQILSIGVVVIKVLHK